MTRMWPWSSGAPADPKEHNELEEQMSPDVQAELDVYDLQPQARQSTAGQSSQAEQAGSNSSQHSQQAG